LRRRRAADLGILFDFLPGTMFMPDAALIANLPRDLQYVDDGQPGIRRRKQGRTFRYYDANGERITDPDEVKRLNALAVPPAYTDVWICADSRGHLQATGRDA